MSIDGFMFEGRDITARQLKREMPAYGEATLQSALESGLQTKADVIAYCERRFAAYKRKKPVGYQAGFKPPQRKWA